MAVVLFTGPDEVFQGNEEGAQHDPRHDEYDQVIPLAAGAGAVGNPFQQPGLVLFANRASHGCQCN